MPLPVKGQRVTSPANGRPRERSLVVWAPTESAKTARSFFRHPGLSQSCEICALDQGSNLQHPPRSGGPQAGDAGVAIVADQPAGVGELSSSAFAVAFESIGGGEE